jgi:hemin uptake protein HemP
MCSDQPPDRGPSSEPHPPAESVRRVRSEDLLQGGRELLITHGQEVYRLRLTKSGKLILGK